MKIRLAGMLLVLALLGAALAPAAQARKQGTILIHANTGQILQECNADESVFPASLTKLMTLYLTFEALQKGTLRLDQELLVSREAAQQPRMNLGLKRGEAITVEQAIMALITRSANDAATVVAEALGGSEDAFAHLMSRRAQELGMKDTLFRNASGLPDREQVTSARDMAKLAEAIWLKFPSYYAYFATQHFNFRGEDIESHNRLLADYDGADGLKTGYTRASGFNLVSSAMRDGQRLIAVVIGGPTAKIRDVYMERLLDYGFRRLDHPDNNLQEPDCKIK